MTTSTTQVNGHADMNGHVHTNGHAQTNGHHKPRVFTLEPLHSEALALAREHFDLVLPGDDDFDTWREEAEGLMARNAVVSPADVAVLARNKLKYISKQGVGVDNFDLDALKQHGIPLMNTPGVNASAVAELALGLIIDVARQLTTIDRRIRNGVAVTKLDGWTGRLSGSSALTGKTLGVVGMLVKSQGRYFELISGGGNIGCLVAKMFHGAFGGKILLYDPYLATREKWDLAVPPPNLTVVDQLDELLAESDVVTLHLPLNRHTENMIAAPQLAKMKPSSIIINTARGGIINEPDLLRALEDGLLYGAGLDAFVNEPPSLKKYPGFCACDRVVLVPHIGAATEAAQQDTCRSMVEHLIEAFEGKALRDRVC